MAPLSGTLSLLSVVLTMLVMATPFARAQLPICSLQYGTGQQYIYSSLTIGTDVNTYNAGPIYVDEIREMLFTTWNGGVYMFPVSINATYAPIFKCPQTQLLQLTIANANETQVKIAVDSDRGILFAGGETGGNASSPVWYAIDYTVSPPNITTMTMSGNFTDAGSGAPKSVDYDNTTKLLISSVDMAPAVIMNLTSIVTQPATWIMGTKPAVNSSIGVNFSSAALDLSLRKAFFAGQQGPSTGSIIVRSVNLNQLTVASAWTVSGATILAAGSPKNFARLYVLSDPGENLYVTGRFLPSSDTSALAKLGYIWSSAPNNLQFDNFSAFPSASDQLVTLATNTKSRRTYIATNAQNKSLINYPSTHKISYLAQSLNTFKPSTFTPLTGVRAAPGGIQGPMWFSSQSSIVDIGFAWHDSFSGDGLDLVAFNPGACPTGYAACQSLSTLCSCRNSSTSTSPLISLNPMLGIAPCIGSPQTATNVSQQFGTCLIPMAPPPSKNKPPPPSALPPPPKAKAPPLNPPPVNGPAPLTQPPPESLPPPADPFPPPPDVPPPVAPTNSVPPPDNPPPVDSSPPPESSLAPPQINPPPLEICPPPTDLSFPPPYGTFFSAQPPPDAILPPFLYPPEDAAPPPPSPGTDQSPNQSPDPSPDASPIQSPSPSPSPLTPLLPMASPAPLTSCGGPSAADTCTGATGDLYFQFSTDGANVDPTGATTESILEQTIRIRAVTSGTGNLPLQARNAVSLDSYVNGASLILTQIAADGSNKTLFFKPATGLITLAAGDEPPQGYVFAMEAIQAAGCSPDNAWQALIGNELGKCTWQRASAGRYARYDPLIQAASASYSFPSDWGSVFVLHLSRVQDWVVPLSVTTVNPTNVSNIQGSVGRLEVGGTFHFFATIDGTEDVTATAAYYPGEAHPRNVRLAAILKRRALLATAKSATVTETVASGLLHLRRGGIDYAPASGSLSFSDVSSRSGDRFLVRTYQFSDCSPADISKLSSFVNCTWQELVDQNVTLVRDEANESVTLGNLGGTWNTLHTLSRVSILAPPAAPPNEDHNEAPGAAAAGVGAQAALIVLAISVGLGVVIGLPLLVMNRGNCGWAKVGSIRRSIRGEGHTA